MKKIIINGAEYKYEAIFVTKRAVGGNIGVVVQLQVFKNGEYLDKIEEHIRECLWYQFLELRN